MDFRKKPQRIHRPCKVNLNVTEETREALEAMAIKRHMTLSEIFEVAVRNEAQRGD